MSNDENLRAFVLDQLADLGAFETKSMFGGTALLIDGKAFAKVKNGALWLKVTDMEFTKNANVTTRTRVIAFRTKGSPKDE